MSICIKNRFKIPEELYSPVCLFVFFKSLDLRSALDCSFLIFHVVFALHLTWQTLTCGKACAAGDRSKTVASGCRCCLTRKRMAVPEVLEGTHSHRPGMCSFRPGKCAHICAPLLPSCWQEVPFLKLSICLGATSCKRNAPGSNQST